MPDPRAQVVRGVETGIHVGEMTVCVIPQAGRLGEPPRVTFVRRSRVRELGPELELELELRRVAAEEERLEEDRRLGVLARVVVRKIEVLRVPARLARDRLADVRVDLRQGVIAAQSSERVRKLGIDVRVVERVPGLVQKRLVVGEPAHGARDQVHDLRRICRDHTGAGSLLRPVVEVELDVRLGGHVEPERTDGGQTDFRRTVLRVRLGQR